MELNNQKMKTSVLVDSKKEFDVSRRRSMPVKSFPIIPMALVITAAALILGIALFEQYLVVPTQESAIQDKSHAAGVAVQSDTLNIKEALNK